MSLGADEGGIGQLEDLGGHAHVASDDLFHPQDWTVFGLQFGREFSIQGGKAGQIAQP